MLKLSCIFSLLQVGLYIIPAASFRPISNPACKYNANQLFRRSIDHTPAEGRRSKEVQTKLDADTSTEAVTTINQKSNATTRRVAVLVCPAQFCVPDDYDVLFENLSKVGSTEEGVEIGTCRVAPLPRTEWIKVARNLPSVEFLEARLPVHSTLKWYFDAMESALNEIFAIEGPDVNICIVGHSIGGWVARAFLGGLSR